MINKCKFCSQSHRRGNCPAYGKICNNCSKRNHFAKCCLSKKVVNDSSGSNDDFIIDSIQVNCLDENKKSSELFQQQKEWKVRMNVNDTNIDFKIDTSAQVNVLPRSIYKKIKPRPKLTPSKVRLTAYNNTEVPVHGKCRATLSNKGKRFNVLFTVV